MININIGGLAINVDDPALACDCTHDTCYVSQNDPSHYESCDCPKVEGQVALSVAPVNDDSWDSVHWAHVPFDELVGNIDDLLSQLFAAQTARGDA